MPADTVVGAVVAVVAVVALPFPPGPDGAVPRLRGPGRGVPRRGEVTFRRALPSLPRPGRGRRSGGDDHTYPGGYRHDLPRPAERHSRPAPFATTPMRGRHLITHTVC